MRLALCALTMFLALPASAEPVSGWLTGEQDDFLQFICKELSPGRKECTFTQVTTRVKQRREEIDALIQKQLPDALEELRDTNREVFCSSFGVYEQATRAFLEGDLETAQALVATMAAEAREEFDFDFFANQIERMHTREVADTLDLLARLTKACKNPNVANLEAFIRHGLEKDARTCKLQLNEWTDIFKKVSDKLWTLEDSSAKGICAVSRLDRFECKEAYSCSYTAEKRVLNKEGEGIIPCSGLEEGAFRYEHGKDIYLDCSIMTWF